MAKKTIPRTCEQCQSSFFEEAYIIKRGGGRFCSISCANQFNLKFRKRQARKACLECGESFPVTPGHAEYVHCSRTCRTAARRNLNLFWAKVRKTDSCWVWEGCTDGYGYGSWCHTGAHRASWVIAHGPIPDGLQVLHHCDNPPCVNPDHLFLGTKKDNALDMKLKGRSRNQHTRTLNPGL